MTPETIRTLGQVRQEFYIAFAAAIDAPANITKGNLYSSNTPRISWTDRHQRLNYLCVYAHVAPDQLLPDRPLILRLGVNKGLGLDARHGKESQQASQKLLRFELTLLPDEILDFVPWLASLLQSSVKSYEIMELPPCRLNLNTLDELLLYGAWTQQATRCFAQKDEHRQLKTLT